MEIVFINSKVIKWVECITKVVQWVLFLEASEIVLHPAGLLLKERNHDSVESQWIVVSNIKHGGDLQGQWQQEQGRKNSSGQNVFFSCFETFLSFLLRPVCDIIEYIWMKSTEGTNGTNRMKAKAEICLR